jgi:hypothetical protein
VVIDPGPDRDAGVRPTTWFALNSMDRDGPLGAEVVDGGAERLGQPRAVERVTGLLAW